MKTAAGAASSSIYLCNNMGNNKGNSVSVTPVSCQIKILVSVCHLPEKFCTLSMTRSILTVPFAFLINVSSLILSWLLILSLPTHCTKVKDTVHYYTVTYMLLIRRRLDDLFSYKNIVNSNSQYLALQHVLFIYRDGTMALARTSGQVLANPDNMAVFCSGRNQLELQKTLQLYVYLQIHQTERENGELHLCQNSGLATAHNDCPCRNCSPWYRYAQANETRSAGVKSQLICS
ncbi:hypothetical protein NP493_127g04055 [Ridgeia piscesae]|uniref:Uncharacterized protein n=1 Tax=Ridgeia piscesae TaxID=27915 RepID=A0AAD9UGS7_RIDPI|nr:hypothetical protein NP493_127g04055 [Ridgeia piscesae]